jgi:predicted nuclease with TOPRIM domain
LRTVVGNFRKVTERLDGLDDDNKKLSDENKELRKKATNVEEQVSQAVGVVRAQEAQQRNQLTSKVSDLSTQVNELMTQLKNGGSNPSVAQMSGSAGSGSDIPWDWVMTMVPAARIMYQVMTV